MKASDLKKLEKLESKMEALLLSIKEVRISSSDEILKHNLKDLEYCMNEYGTKKLKHIKKQ